MTVLYESNESAWPLLARGKVRDVYEYAPNELLIVTSDRLSAFDVVLPTPIPEKGVVLTQISNFWFARTSGLVPNHLIEAEPFATDAEHAHLAGRSVVVHRAEALPVEAIVRGYLTGSGRKDYERTGAVCGIRLPEGLVEASRLPEPIFTPSTKAEQGAHDENIDFAGAVDLLGSELAEKVRDTALELYRVGAEYALERGIIIADTKFEFGLLDGELILIDEALTPDSSRFWPLDGYEEGLSQPSFDKQYVRDYLETLDWGKTAPGPELPPEVAQRTSEKYVEAWRRLTQA
ncbi:MAG: phosphoribosylaminoimidazolesuccinocarboxamide synthase [Thermoleophilia bacterium]|jgi:phosphoribosylaminoimidazole-succinocarboxamide synthase|nr:phosphoribosylaminoimidazolesuccinocarboxamide synthase [Thermoleophilia bacterium]